jgi:hypothetical protein
MFDCFAPARVRISPEPGGWPHQLTCETSPEVWLSIVGACRYPPAAAFRTLSKVLYSQIAFYKTGAEAVAKRSLLWLSRRASD